jgi:hypothetical protein
VSWHDRHGRCLRAGWWPKTGEVRGANGHRPTPLGTSLRPRRGADLMCKESGGELTSAGKRGREAAERVATRTARVSDEVSRASARSSSPSIRCPRISAVQPPVETPRRGRRSRGRGARTSRGQGDSHLTTFAGATAGEILTGQRACTVRACPGMERLSRYRTSLAVAHVSPRRETRRSLSHR